MAYLEVIRKSILRKVGIHCHLNIHKGQGQAIDALGLSILGTDIHGRRTPSQLYQMLGKGSEASLVMPHSVAENAGDHT